jgi:hypothetical protein
MTQNNVNRELRRWKKLCKIYRSSAFANTYTLEAHNREIDFVYCNACVEAVAKEDQDIPGKSCNECGEMICSDCSEMPNKIWVDKPHKCNKCTKFILCSCEDICISCREKKEKEEEPAAKKKKKEDVK